ncbi:hypothetical protein DNI29_16435 [Hymenobacter sediminis]|uniref:hypothetical protein n=1 Tax=Hymenobacter sediminis TaxID=2218621 RepID=UPI000DA64373|nr:hypothetical protein [Hymenobacter sediminis]RPD45744.1 hypothetical protein DNI29_16435 [Hymenobacter sediminis]
MQQGLAGWFTKYAYLYLYFPPDGFPAVTRLFAWFLCLLFLLQTFSRELQVIDYQVRRAQITRLFCVNKNRPQLHCNGKCHLVKLLRKAARQESKAPAAGYAKLKYEVLLCPAYRLPIVKREAPAKADSFAGYLASCYAFSSAHSIFHPPALKA